MLGLLRRSVDELGQTVVMVTHDAHAASVADRILVLADGRLLELGHRTVKGVTGYDLTALVIGSEGTLGIVVEATLRLRPLARGEVVTVSAAFPDVESAARASAAITASGVRPAALELLDASATAAIGEYLGIELAGTQLLVQTDGASAGEEADAVAALIAEHGGVARRAADAAEGERLFAVRRAFHPAMERLGAVLIEDVAVPRTALPAMLAAIGDIEWRYGIRIPTVAHAGDGNLHPNFVIEDAGAGGHLDVPEHVWAAADEMFRACLRLGGTLTGEHGVGTLKRRWLREELGDDGYELQRRIKAVFDPAGIMNPGKVF